MNNKIWAFWALDKYITSLETRWFSHLYLLFLISSPNSDKKMKIDDLIKALQH